MERLKQWLDSKGLGGGEAPQPCQWTPEINEKIKRLKPPRLRGVPLQKVRYVVFDTETTGFHPKKGDEILSVGAVVLEDGKLQKETFHRFIKPRRSVPPIVTDLTGITQQMADAGEEAGVVIRDFLDFAGPCILVGHSVNFDLGFMNHTLRGLSCCSLNHPSLDTYWLAQATYPGYADLSLDGLLNLFQIEGEGRHTALGDAILTANVLQNLLAKLDKNRFVDYIDLKNFIQGQNWQEAITGHRHITL